MPGKRPINADVAPSAPQAEPVSTPASHAPETDTAGVRSEPDARRGRKASSGKRRRRKTIPAALKAIAGLVILAVIFLVAAVLGGGSSDQGSNNQESAPAPTSSAEGTERIETPTAAAAEELGYPSFATNNTTRVGGADPATTAAGVALAVFPSTTQAQRPAAVTLVDESDWQGAIAASVLMAAPVKAPVLLTDGGDLPDPTSQALEALDPQGSDATGKAQAFVDRRRSDTRRPEGEGSQTGGIPRRSRPRWPSCATSSSAPPPQHIVLAPEGDSAIAMPAAAWAARSGDPVLFSGADKTAACDGGSPEAAPEGPGLRARPLFGDLLRCLQRSRQGRQAGTARLG